MWTWDQSSGVMTRAGKSFAGYAGNGRGKNNPAMQAAKGIGPIPAGKWRMVEQPYNSPNTGPYTIKLQPELGTNAFGRSEFRIHGDSIKSPGTASHGCIILPRAVREAIWGSGDRELLVLE